MLSGEVFQVGNNSINPGGEIMRIQALGDRNKPVIVMLSGSFCKSGSLKYLYEKLAADYCIILPEYNGHYENSTFTTRQNEAGEIKEYIQQNGIDRIRMLYGQSMGAEVTIELLRQLTEVHIEVDHIFLDGAPCIKLSPLYKKVMYLKFRSMINMIRKKDVDELLNGKLMKKFSNGDTESLRPMLEAIASQAAVLTDETVKNETECCYTFDFPTFDETVQRKMHFFYGGSEKAYRLCCDGVKKAYPKAVYTVADGYGHLTYSIKETDAYIKLLRSVCEE